MNIVVLVVQFTVCAVHFTLLKRLCAECSVHCEVCNIQCLVNTVQCAVCIVQSAVLCSVMQKESL